MSAKNAIVIVEFAKDLWKPGKSLVEATVEASTLRFRPIAMTSLAFIFGVVPPATATGALRGMISATILAVLFVPVFFVVVMRLFRVKTGGPEETRAEPSARPATAE